MLGFAFTIMFFSLLHMYGFENFLCYGVGINDIIITKLQIQMHRLSDLHA